MTNELYFHALADLGHGLRLPEPLTRYRVHEESMTDRYTPGVFADYMASVCVDLSARLDRLCGHPPGWARADQLATLAARYRARAAEHRDDAHRQREQSLLGVTREGPSA